jgi:hypothetical protein
MNESEAAKYSFKAFRHPKGVEVELIKKRTSYDFCVDSLAEVLICSRFYPQAIWTHFST